MQEPEIPLIKITELRITLADYYKYFLLQYPFKKFKDLPNGVQIYLNNSF